MDRVVGRPVIAPSRTSGWGEAELARRFREGRNLWTNEPLRGEEAVQWNRIRNGQRETDDAA
jgi:hypothetical protein